MIAVRAALWIASSVLLYFGLTLPIVAFNVDVADIVQTIVEEQPIIAILLRAQGIDVNTVIEAIPPREPSIQSIVSSVEELFRLESYASAGIIFVFSILIPIIKQLIFGLALVFWTRPIQVISDVIGDLHKWAMLDVFVLGIVVVALTSQEGWSAELLPGLYWFLAYFFTSAVMMATFRFTRRPAAEAPQPMT